MNLEHWRHYLVARLFELVRQPSRALAAYHNAVRCNPRFVKALNGIAFLEGAKGRWQASEQYFVRALELDAGNANALFNLGFVRGKLGQHATAIDAFREAVRLRPVLDRAWFGMGLEHAALGQHAEAARALQRAADLQPMNPHAWYALGMAFHHSHQPDRVKEVVEHLVRFDPLMARRLIQEAERSDLAHLVKELAV